MRRVLRSVLVLGAALGCTPPSDLGQPCTMWRKTPNGGHLPMLNRDLDGGDQISFLGNACAELTCLRDGHAAPAGDADALVQGYCSTRCQEGTTCETADPRRPLQCRRLTLTREQITGPCTGKCSFLPDGPFFACAR